MAKHKSTYPIIEANPPGHHVYPINKNKINFKINN